MAGGHPVVRNLGGGTRLSMSTTNHSPGGAGARQSTRYAPFSHFSRAWQLWLQALATLAMALAGVLVPAALPANAASATIYLGGSTSGSLNNATDPHGGIWLRGTVDGTTNGALNT